MSETCEECGGAIVGHGSENYVLNHQHGRIDRTVCENGHAIEAFVLAQPFTGKNVKQLLAETETPEQTAEREQKAEDVAPPTAVSVALAELNAKVAQLEARVEPEPDPVSAEEAPKRGLLDVVLGRP